MTNNLFDFLRMGGTTNTPPVRHKMRSVLLLFAVLLSVGAWGADPVIVSKTIHDLYPDDANGTAECTLYSMDPLSISVNCDGNNGKIYGTGTEWRLYQGGNAVVTVALSEGDLSSVTFTFSTSNGGKLSYGDNVLTSGTAINVSGTSATFSVGNTGTATNGQVRISGFSVTYTPSGSGSGKTDITNEQLAWSAASATVTLGDEPYTFPSLTNTIPVSVSYQSTDETVAPISDMGVVSILKAGTTTIKAIFDGNDDYNAKTISYTLTVSPAPLTPIVGGIVDELQISDLLTSGSGYQSFSGKQASNTGHSDAVYAGKVCISGSNIQMNTIGTNTSAGREIATSTSGGYAKRVQAIWGGTNTADRKLTIYGSNSAYSGSETATSGTKLGELTYTAGSVYEYIDITGDYEYIQIVASGAMYMSQINITWLPKDESKVATPSIDGTANFYPSTDVTITCGTDDADIYYTTNGATPTTSSTKYTGTFSVNNTTTIKAIAIKEGLTDSEEAVATFTKITPLTVAQALVEATGSGKYVTGTITSVTEVNIGYKNATYVISDISAGIPQNEMIVYRGKYIDGADFTSSDQIHVGDVVVVSGSIAVHAEKNQMAQGNQIETISAAAVSAPVFDPNGGGFVVSTDVTIAAAGAEHIYYTTNGDNPTKASNEYTGAIHLDATTTIKAIAYIGEESSLVVEKTFTLTNPKTVAEAYDELVSADLENVAVEGIVYDLSISSGNATYWISDDGNAGAKVLEVFKGKGIEGADVAAGDIREGDKVIVFGTLTIYTGGSEGVKEFKQGSHLLSLTRKTVESVAVTGSPTKTNYKVGDAFDPAGLTVTVTYDDASHATVAVADCSWEKDPATFDAAGTGLSVSVKATYDGVQSPAFVVGGLSVKAIPTFDDPNYEWQLVTGASQLVAGKYYVIGSASAGNTAIKTITSGYLGTVASTIADGVIAYNALGENTAIFELGGESGAWTLVEAIEEKQLTGATTANFVWDGATNTTWPISIDGENAIIGASDGYRVLYNVNSPRFKPYNSATNASMVLPQLYVWALKTNKLRYDANEGENAPAAQPAVAGEATVTSAVPTREDYIFTGWNTLANGSGEAKAAGDVIDLSAGDVTLYAQWRTPETVTISYDANGGEGTMYADADQTEGSQYTIKANEFTREGYNFAGWKAYDADENELTITNGKFIVPATNVTVKAQWGEWTATDFALVTDINQLQDGDKVYIVAAGYDKAMGTQNTNNYRNEVAIHKAGNMLGILEGSEPVEFTLGKDGDKFTFQDNEGYLYAAGTANSGKNYINTKAAADAACDWSITIDENGTVISSVANAFTPYVQFNSAASRFSCYHTESMQAVVLYKKANYARATTEGRFGTICLPNGGVMVGAELYEVAYYSESENKIFFDEILNGKMVAGRPYIFLPEEGTTKLGVLYTDAENAPAGSFNGLIGSYMQELLTPNDGNYVLYNNQYMSVETDNVAVGANRAYIKLASINTTPTEPRSGRRRVAMGVLGANAATGIGNVQGEEIQSTKVLINGQLFILRGEKMYDATGRMVK